MKKHIELNLCISITFRFFTLQGCFLVVLKNPLIFARISTAENFEGFYFAISWTGLTKVDKSVQRLTEEREGKEQGSNLI